MATFRTVSSRWLLAGSLVALSLVAVPCVANAQGVAIEQATDAQKKEAQGHYDRGARAFDQKKYEDAFNAFAASYGVVKSPNAHMMMARALMGLGRFARAYNELTVVEEEATGNPKYAATLERSKELRAEALPKVSVITVKLVGQKSGPVRVTAGDALIPIDRAHAIDPGKITVKALVNDSQTDAKEVDAASGKEQVVELKVGDTAPPPVVAPPVGPVGPQPVQPPPPVTPPDEDETPRSPAATGLLIGGTAVSLLGLGGMAVGAGFYFAAKEDHDFLMDPEQSGCRVDGDSTICPESLQDRIDAGETNQRNAAIAVGVGGGVTAIGLGLLIAGGVLAGSPKSDDTASVQLDVGLGSLGLRGAF